MSIEKSKDAFPAGWPLSFVALQKSIEEFQKEPDELRKTFTEDVLKDRIKRVANSTFLSLAAASGLMKIFQNPLALMSCMICLDKDNKLGREGTDKSYLSVMNKLNKTRVGQESVFRVVVDVLSSLFPGGPEKEVPEGISEIIKASTVFAVQPLEEELRQEKSYSEFFEKEKKPQIPEVVVAGESKS